MEQLIIKLFAISIYKGDTNLDIAQKEHKI